MIDWKFYPANVKISDPLLDVVKVFERHESRISSLDGHTLDSNAVLAEITISLQELGYCVETSKAKKDKIRVPVTYKERGEIDLAFEADAYHEKNKIVLEVEAGRAVDNN